MANGELFIPNGLLDASRGWQEVIDSVSDPEAKQAAGLEACAALGKIDGYFGTRKVIVKSDMALMVKDSRDKENPLTAITAIKFRELTLKGWLGRVSYIEAVGYGSLAWRLFDATVLAHGQRIDAAPGDVPPTEEEVYQTTAGKLKKPIVLPVGFIDYALCAA